jgi:hypothetical protein
LDDENYMSTRRLSLSLATLVGCLLLHRGVGGGVVFEAIILGTGYPHVLLGLKYSRRGIKVAMGRTSAKLTMLIAVPLGLLAITYGWDLYALVFYFGLHHALSETYFDKDGGSRHGSWKKGLLVLCIFSGYLSATRAQLSLGSVCDAILFATALASSAAFLTLNRSELVERNRLLGFLNNHSWVLLGPALAVLAVWYPIDWKVIILYHFGFYGLLPLVKQGMLSDSKRRTFWIEGAVWNGLGLSVFLGSVIFAAVWIIPSLFWVSFQCFLALTYMHITWSFLISPGNPGWIKKLFGQGREVTA